MKSNEKPNQDSGITLVALIITIIILVILAVVSIKAVYDSKIVGYAVNSSYAYQEEAIKEESMLNNAEKYLASIKSGAISGEGNIEINQGDLTTLIDKVNKLEEELTNLKSVTTSIDKIYPIGSIYMTSELSTKEEVAEKLRRNMGKLWTGQDYNRSR